LKTHRQNCDDETQIYIIHIRHVYLFLSHSYLRRNVGYEYVIKRMPTGDGEGDEEKRGMMTATDDGR
jgi:hypothetical protein